MAFDFKQASFLLSIVTVYLPSRIQARAAFHFEYSILKPCLAVNYAYARSGRESWLCLALSAGYVLQFSHNAALFLSKETLGMKQYFPIAS